VWQMSSREYDSWSNNTSPGCNGRSPPTLRATPTERPSPTSESPASDEAKETFVIYFKSLHAELRLLLKHLVELATKAAADRSERQVAALRNAYKDFTEALSVHACIEETILFSKLNEKVPQITDSYYWDHDRSRTTLTVIERTLGLEREHISTDLSPEAYCKLFMQVSELAAVHTRK
jgi:iron-sulfur cluster repair protein YtfE (RIC family)